MVLDAAQAVVSAAASGVPDRSTISALDGSYSLTLPIGTYDVSVTVFGYLSQTLSATVTEGATTQQPFALDAAPSFAVSGHVRDATGAAIAGAVVTILDTPIPAAITDASGAYSFAQVPVGTYQISAKAGHCNATQTLPLNVNANVVVDFSLATAAARPRISSSTRPTF